MSAGGHGASNDAKILSIDEIRAIENRNEGEAARLETLAREAEQAAAGALAKVDKQKAHLDAAKAEAKTLQAVATKARKVADGAQEG